MIPKVAGQKSSLKIQGDSDVLVCEEGENVKTSKVNSSMNT